MITPRWSGTGNEQSGATHSEGNASKDHITTQRTRGGVRRTKCGCEDAGRKQAEPD